MPHIATVAIFLTAALRYRAVRGFGSCPLLANAYRSTPVRLTSSEARMSVSGTTNQPSFVEFLESTQTNASERLKRNNTAIQLVMGNEAGDADSIVSALSLAHVTNLSRNSSSLHVPIVSIPRLDLPLRRDAVLLLDMAGISTNELIFVDDEIVNGLLDSSDTAITLVDHNRIRSSLSHLSDKVSAILDHHEDVKSHDKVTIDSGNRVIAFEDGIATVASTCTLVAEKLLQSTGQSIAIDRSLGLVLLGVILLDSVNMLPEAGKGTARDETAIQNLLKQTDWSATAKRTPSFIDDTAVDKIFPNGRGTQPDRTALFNALSGAKFDAKFWHEMSAIDCLRIDYKKFPVAGSSCVQSIGISTVLIDIKSVLEKPNFHHVMGKYVASENVDIFGVMSMYEDDKGSWKRELLLTGNDANLVDSFAEYLLSHADSSFLQITEQTFCTDQDKSSGMRTRIFSQGNVKGSRKQVAPVLLNYASTLEQ